MKYLVLISFVVGAVLVYLLASASANTDLFASNFPYLLAVTGALVAGLLVLVGYQIFQLRQKIRNGVFGAKLTLRLMLMFGLMALLPGAIIYTVSFQFLSKSIESWFDVRVDNALGSGLNLGQAVLDNQQRELTKKAESMALSLADEAPTAHIHQLSTLREQYGVQEATLFSERGKIIAFAGNERAGMMPMIPSNTVLWQVRQQQPYARIESLPSGGLIVRVVVPVNLLSFTENIRVLQLIQPVPAKLADDAEAVRTAYQDYQELSLSRLGLKRLYGLTLTLTLLLALLATVALAFLISEQMAAPLRALAKGTRAVAKGDFSQMHPVHNRDELGVLTQSFNRMTRQLADARNATEVSREQIEKSYAYLENILANLTSGVIAFDEQLQVRTINPVAEQMLGIAAGALRNVQLYQWGNRVPALAAFANALAEQFNLHGTDNWKRQIELDSSDGKHTLLAHATHLPSGVDNGFVLVFDDITHLIKAQRDAAWGEVARRLAHEIKNPLTPIQLSAERIQHKFASKLDAADAETLARATQTIVNQVSAMKHMVNAFAEYARTPAVQLEALKLNSLVREVLRLYDLGPDTELALTPNLPLVMGDATLLRQVIHNLLQNAQDALADNPAPHIVLSTAQTEDGVSLTIRDNGPGFPPELMTRLFEPYATTKPKGTGLGLAIVKKIIEEHHGMIRIENVQPHGAIVCIRLPAARGEAV
ncbi:MAG: ATP-binding protein [Pseudomonadota bacterium]